MSVFDSLANRFHLGDDDDYEDDDLDYEDEDEYEDEPPRRTSIFGGKKQQSYNDDSEDYEESGRSSRATIKGTNSAAPVQRGGGAQVTPIRSPRSNLPANGSKMQVRIIKPSSFDQARQITDTLLAHRTVLLNLEGLDVNTAQRIVDFASGSCYALHGNFMKISHFIIVITPEDVDIAGDIIPNATQAAAMSQRGAQNGMYGNQGMNQMGGMNNGMNGMNGMGTVNGMQNDANNPFMNAGMSSDMSGMNGGY